MVYVENGLQSIVNWGKAWCVNFNASETKLFSFNQLIGPFLSRIDMAGANLQGSDSLRHLELPFQFNGKTIIARDAAKKIGSLSCPRQFSFLASILKS